jgi:hypothetical protein
MSFYLVQFAVNFFILGCGVLINKKLDMVQEENDVSCKVADAAATVVQDLLPTLHFTCTA